MRLTDNYRVELHGYPPRSPFYQEDDIDGVTDVTAYVTSLKWTHAVRDPWETINATLQIPIDRVTMTLPGLPNVLGPGLRWPQTGFWIVVSALTITKQNRSPRMRVVAWGVCTSISTGASGGRRDGMVATQRVSLTVASWISSLQRSRMILTANLQTEQDLSGFLYRLQTWQPVLTELMSVFEHREPGGLLAALLPKFARFWVPPTLATPIPERTSPAVGPSGLAAALNEALDILGFLGGVRRIGDEVRVVFDPDTARKWAPSRHGQVLSVPGWAINAIANRVPHGNAWDLISSTFEADPNLVELFPDVEFAEDEPPGPHPSPLPGAYGFRPILVYRLKPYQFDPLNLATVRQFDPEANRPMEAERADLFQDVVSRDTWGMYEWTAAQVTDWQIGWSDSERINATQVRTPYQPENEIAQVGIIGEPMLFEEGIRKHGLRWYEGEWPFFPVGTDPEQESTYTQRIDALNEYAFASCGRSEVFGSGSFTGEARPEARAGNWITVDFPNQNSVTGTAEPFDQQSWIVFRLHAYAESVTTSVDVVDRDGNYKARTTVQYVRASGNKDGEPLAPYYGRRYNVTPVSDLDPTEE